MLNSWQNGTGTGIKGNSFSTPQLGIRAQIQHLQAYASTNRLKNRCVDPRYTYVNRGCAPYVEESRKTPKDRAGQLAEITVRKSSTF